MPLLKKEIYNQDMDTIKARLGGFDPSTTPFLGVHQGVGKPGLILPIGTRIDLVWGPGQEGGIIPLVLSKIDRQFIDFWQFSMDLKSSRSVRFKAKWAGNFVSALKGSAQTATATFGGDDD